MNYSILQILTLGLAAAVGLAFAVRFYRLDKSIFSIRALVTLNYTATILISGVVHLSTPEAQRRGYFDLLSQSNTSTIARVTVISILGLAILVAAMGGFNQKGYPIGSYDTEPHLARKSKTILIGLSLLIAPLSAISLIRVGDYAATLDATRLLTFTDGLAKFVYASQWSVWAVAFTAIALLIGKARPKPIFVAFLLAGIIAVSVVTFTWSGGRSILITFLLPILILMVPLLRKLRAPFIILGVALAGLYVYMLSEKRLTYQGGASLTTVLDWEWGRFSMLGFASAVTEREGYLMGETLYSGFHQLVTGILGVAGISVDAIEARGASQIAGQHILASVDQYIVPGVLSEAIMNFGVPGMAVTLILLGLGAKFAQQKISTSTDYVGTLFWAYLGSLIVFRTLNADSWSLPNYLLYSGTPLLIAFLLTRKSERRSSKTPVQVGLDRPTEKHYAP